MLRFGFMPVLLAILVQAASVFGQEAANANLMDDWKKTVEQRDEILKQIDKLKTEFSAAADAKQKGKIREDFEKVAKEFNGKILPKMSELAPKVFAADPKNLEAGEVAMEVAFDKNQFPDAAKFAKAMIDAGRRTVSSATILGVSQFANHDFQAAKTSLEAADKDRLLHQQQGAPYLDAVNDYLKFWATEKELRDKEAAYEGDKKLPRVKFETTKGNIVLELFEDQAPNTVANFISLVEGKKYDGVKFHRVIPKFMIQGGDPLSLDNDPRNDGTGGPGYNIPCECYEKNARMHFRGSLSMAHAGKDTGGSQFFITHLPTPHLNPNAQRQSGHTVFGRVVEGFDALDGIVKDDKIITATVLNKRSHEYKPTTHPERSR